MGKLIFSVAGQVPLPTHVAGTFQLPVPSRDAPVPPCPFQPAALTLLSGRCLH